MEVKRVITPLGQQLQKSIESLGDKVGKVGWFKNAKYEDGTQVAAVAVTQEYGSPLHHIPPRPTMRPTIAAKKNSWAKIIESGSRKVIKGEMTATELLDLVGSKAAGDVKRAISKLWEPPLAPATIEARLHKRAKKQMTRSLMKPLIDTGHMLGTLTNTVEDE